MRCGGWVIAALGEGGTGGDPACAAAHDFDNLYEVVLAHAGIVSSDLLNGASDVFDDRAVAGSVICCDEVVIDRLWNTNHTQCIATLLGQLGNLVRGVLGIIATGIKEVADIVCLEYLEHTVVVFLALELETAGAECGTRSVTKCADRLLGFVGKVDQLLLENAEDAVLTAVDLFDALVVERFGDCTGEARVNDGCGAAGLGDQAISYKFFGHNVVLSVKLMGCV